MLVISLIMPSLSACRLKLSDMYEAPPCLWAELVFSLKPKKETHQATDVMFVLASNITHSIINISSYLPQNNCASEF